MNGALTAWGNRVSPVFDAARELLVFSIAESTISRRRYEAFQPERPDLLAKRLQELQVRAFICGAITEMSAAAIQSGGIELIPFIAGSLDEVLEAYARGVPIRQIFPMPGCSGKRHRHKHCRHPGGRGPGPRTGCSLADGIHAWRIQHLKNS